MDQPTFSRKYTYVLESWGVRYARYSNVDGMMPMMSISTDQFNGQKPPGKITVTIEERG